MREGGENSRSTACFPCAWIALRKSEGAEVVNEPEIPRLNVHEAHVCLFHIFACGVHACARARERTHSV